MLPPAQCKDGAGPRRSCSASWPRACASAARVNAVAGRPSKIHLGYHLRVIVIRKSSWSAGFVSLFENVNPHPESFFAFSHALQNAVTSMHISRSVVVRTDIVSLMPIRLLTILMNLLTLFSFTWLVGGDRATSYSGHTPILVCGATADRKRSLTSLSRISPVIAARPCAETCEPEGTSRLGASLCRLVSALEIWQISPKMILP